ncbi:MAG TPA: head maturation protease, ClpP-related [Rickettsiales bacterium]|nr:head maturation protease, ClpP-related [Rickettsiales bacterium]
MNTINTINITGVIGLDTRYEDIVKQLNNCKSNLNISINSPGGYVFDGIAIYNAIKTYNKGIKTIKVCGLSASIASYIMLAGDSLELENNSVIMIHNPSVAVIGDYRKLKTACSQITKLRDLMSESYSKYTGISKSSIEKMMDDETYFIGSNDLKTWGHVVESDNKDTTKTKLTKAEAEIQIQSMCSLIEKDNKEKNKDIEKLVALLEDYPEKDQTNQAENQKNQTNQTDKQPKPKDQYQNNNPIINNPKETKMEKLETLQDLKILYPKLYNEAVQDGMNSEKSRVKAHLEFIDVAPEIALNAVKDGTSFLNNSEIQAKYIKAKINKNEITTMEKDNNPDLIAKKIDEDKEIKAETEKANTEAEAKIRAFMPHLNNPTNLNTNNNQ